MLFSTWLRNWKRSFERQSTRRQSRRQKQTGCRRSCPLTVERLEDRTVPSLTSVAITDFGTLSRDNSGNLTAPAGTSITLGGRWTDDGNNETDAFTNLNIGMLGATWTVSRNGRPIPGDTVQADAVGAPPDFTFTPTENGTYVVTLTGTEDDGVGQATDSVTIDVAPAVSIQGTGTLGTTGSLDPSFGTGGQSVTSLGTGGDYFSAVATQKDGKTVAAGGTGANFNEILLARYDTDGSLDTNFGNGGYASTTVPNGGELGNINTVAIDSQGRIVLAGWMQATDGSNQPFLARYLSNGTLDTDPTTGFGTLDPATGSRTGIVSLSIGMLSPNSIAIDGSDGILVASKVSNSTNQLVRITSSGALDTTFGSTGTGVQTIQTTANLGSSPFPAINFFPPSSPVVTIDGHDRILLGQMEVVGTNDLANGPDGSNLGIIACKSELEVACFTSNGNLDPSFGSAGIATMDVSSEADSYGPLSLVFGSPQGLNLYGIAADNQGGSVIEIETGTGEAELVRLTSSGALDTNPATGFGPLDPATGSRTGIVSTPICPGTFTLNDFAVQPDGQMLIWGSFSNNDFGAFWGVLRRTGWGVARYNPDGSPDSSFGPGGVAQIDMPSANSIQGIAAESNGNILLVGAQILPDGTNNFLREQVVGAPPHSPVGVPLSFTSTVNDPNPSPSYQWTVTKDGSSYVLPDGTMTHSADFSFTPNAIGNYVVTLSVTDPDLTTVSDSKTIEVDDPFSYNGMQTALDSQPPIDPTTGNPTVTLQGNTQAQADDFMALFQDPATPGFTPLQPPAGATTPIDIVVTFDSSAQLNEAALNIPDGIRVQINGGTWLGGSPALTLSSGDLTITGATFANATNAPTILVNAGHLTLRNDVIQESTGYSRSAIAITGGTVDLGTAASPGGNTLNINGSGSFIQNATSTPVTAVGSVFLVNGVALAPDSLSGIVFKDFNDDGQVDFGEQGIAGVAVALTGTDFLGNAVSMSATTDSDGAYIFANLQPGTYSITETQPAGYNQGIDTVGTAGGSLTATDKFFVSLAQDAIGLNGLNYNFGEQPQATGSIQKGQTAGIGFWNNKNGQALIKSFNGGTTSTQLAAWLADTLPHIFGVNAGSNKLIHADGSYFTNTEVAARFQQDFVLKGVKLDAQVLATALSVYATNATLDNTGVAANYGFVVSGDGLGTAGVNVGSNGDAFGVANNTVMTVLDLLKATDALAVDGLLYNGDAVKRKEANSVYSAINDAGNIG